MRVGVLPCVISLLVNVSIAYSQEDITREIGTALGYPYAYLRQADITERERKLYAIKAREPVDPLDSSIPEVSIYSAKEITSLKEGSFCTMIIKVGKKGAFQFDEKIALYKQIDNSSVPGYEHYGSFSTIRSLDSGLIFYRIRTPMDGVDAMYHFDAAQIATLSLESCDVQIEINVSGKEIVEISGGERYFKCFGEYEGNDAVTSRFKDCFQRLFKAYVSTEQFKKIAELNSIQIPSSEYTPESSANNAGNSGALLSGKAKASEDSEEYPIFQWIILIVLLVAGGIAWRYWRRSQ